MLTITSAKIRFACFFALVALASTTANAQLVRGSMSIEEVETTSLHATSGKFVLSYADEKATSSVFSVKATLLSQDAISPIRSTVISPVVDDLDITGVALADLKAVKDLPLVAPKKRFKFTSL